MISSLLNRKVRQAIFLCLLGLLSANVFASAEIAPLQHGPVLSTSAGKSVPINVTLAEADTFLEVRLYFKTMAAADYLFLPMTGSGKGVFTASLPPAKNDTRGIDYLLLLKNSQGETRKTKPFRLLVLNDYNAPVPFPGEFEVFTEKSSFEVENRDFAIPLQLVQSPEPLLAWAVEDPYPPRAITTSGSGEKVFTGLSGLSGVSFSIKIGGVGFFYRGFSGH